MPSAISDGRVGRVAEDADLVGPAADRAQPQVARGALDLVLAHVARAAEDLDRLVGHLLNKLTRDDR